MNPTDPEIVLVNLGVYQAHITEAIKNLQLFGNHHITVLTEPHFFQKFKKFQTVRLINTREFDLEFFEKNCKLDDSFRHGFWKNASKRLFCLYQYMKTYNRKNCIHIENDVMVFKDLKSIVPDEKKLWMVMENQKKALPSILFIPDHSFLENLVENYIFDKNDMENMGLFFNKNRDICRTFPIIKKSVHYNKTDIFCHHFETFGCLFDGASIGQYLGGNDPRNASGPRRRLLLSILRFVGLDHNRFLLHDTRGFINTSCVVDYSKYSFGWKKVEDKYVPHILIEEEWIPIVNLHIHSKWLQCFRGVNPTETKLIPLLNK